MITETIAGIAVKCLDIGGYVSAAILMALESMIAPVPSEAVMPFVGFQVADGKWNLFWSIFSTSLGSIVGSFLSYLMGYYGGRPFILKVGKYLLLNVHDLEITEKFFHRRAGVWTLFISRFIPVVRHLISIPAGIGKMPMISFMTATLIGATIWNSFLLWCGMRLRANWEIVQKYSHHIDIVVVLTVIAVLVWFIHSRLKAMKARPSSE